MSNAGFLSSTVEEVYTAWVLAAYAGSTSLEAPAKRRKAGTNDASDSGLSMSFIEVSVFCPAVHGRYT